MRKCLRAGPSWVKGMKAAKLVLLGGPYLAAALLSALLSTPGVRAAEIKGRISPASKLISIEAIDRSQERRYQATVDLQGGNFALRNLPTGCYDLLVKTREAGIEGVNIRAARGVGGPEEEAPALTKEDRDRIAERVKRVKTFEEHKRILLLAGTGSKAKVLVELMRTGKTTLPSRKPFVIWRVEVWDYFKLYGTWRRRRGLGQVIRRQRIDGDDFSRLSWLFEPELGGLELGEPDDVREIHYEIPDPLSKLPGRYLGKESPPEPLAEEVGEGSDDGRLTPIP